MCQAELHGVQRGSILVFVLVFTVLVGAASAALVAESNAGLKLRRMRNKQYRTLTDSLNGLDMARNAIETSNYDANGHNLALWNLDSTADGVAGANPLVNNNRVRVTVSYLGNFWYQLDSTATSDDGEMTKQIRQHVREKDFWSRYALFIENGAVNIADTTSYYGPVHVNKNVSFRDDVSGVGTQVHGFMSSTLPFTFSGNAAAETTFYEGFADDLGSDGWITLPPSTALSEYKDHTGAYSGSGQELWSTGTGGNKIEIRKGPGGFAVSGKCYTYIELIYDKDTGTQYVKVTIKDTSGSTLFTSPLTGDYEMLDEGVIYVAKGINGIKGDMHNRVTIAVEKGDINISADLYYVDDEGDRPMIFDPAHPENDNYLENPDYDGHAVLGLVAQANILYTGAEDDANLEINAAVMALEGQVKWGGSGNKEHLRVFGSRISDGQTYRYTGTGYASSGVYFYDDNLKIGPPPKFLPIAKPLFIGFQVIK